jgi:uncharacterized protein (TIGR03437 family)
VRTWLMAVALAGAAAPYAGAQIVAPYYTAESIVNGATFVPGPLAPNGLATIFGTNLSYYTHLLSPDDLQGGLPFDMGSVRVRLGGYPVPLYYVSPTQINFLVPMLLRPGTWDLVVDRQGNVGPRVWVQGVDAAPALFPAPGGYLLASHADYSLVTPDSPAKPGEAVILWGTGFGETSPSLLNSNQLPLYPSQISRLADLFILVDNVVLDRARVLYCGLTPGFSGLYQANVRLPDEVGPNPEIRVAIGGQISAAGMKLAVAPAR